MPMTLEEFMAEGDVPEAGGSGGTMTLAEFMGDDAGAGGGMSLDEFMAEGEDAATEPAQGSWESLGFPSRDQMAANDEQAAADAGLSVYDSNLKLAAESDKASLPGRIIGGAISSAADAVVNPLLAAESALGFETAGDMLQDRQARADMRGLAQESWGEWLASNVVNSLAQVGAITHTGGGLAGLLTSFGTQAYTNAERQAIKEGKTEGEASTIARAVSAVEVGVMAAFQRAGLGGMEQAFLKSSPWQGVKNFAIQTLGELGEEELTTIGQQLAQTGEVSGEALVDTAVQSIATMGLVGGAQGISNFVKQPNRKTAAEAGVDGVAGNHKARTDLADGLLLDVAQKVSTDWVNQSSDPNSAAVEPEVVDDPMVAASATAAPAPTYSEADDAILSQLQRRLKRKLRDGGFRPDEMDTTVDRFSDWFKATGYQQFKPGVRTDSTTTNAPEASTVEPEVEVVDEGQPASEQPAAAAGPPVPSGSTAGFVPKSFLQLDAIGSTASRAVRDGKRWFKQQFLSGGEQNDATRNLLSDRDGTIRKHLAELSQNSRDLNAAVHKAYSIPRHRQLPDTVSQALDAALKDQSLMSSLPTDVAVELQKMRDHVDGLSQIVKTLPDVGADLQLSIDQNMGQYITRTYKKFGNTDAWARKAMADPSIMADFAAEVRQSSPAATDDEIRQLAEILLRRNTSSMADMGRFTPRTNKFVDVMKARKDLSPAVRRLYGERTDAFENYTETISKLSNLVAHRQFVDNLKQAGMAQGFFSDAAAPVAGHVQEVNHKNIPQLRGLEGVLMAPEIADSINDIYTTHTPGKAERIYLAAMGLTKAAKTVGSLQATVRNFTGNAPIAMANGVWNPKQLAGATKLAWWNDLLNKGDAATKAEVRNLHELGVIEGVTVETLRDIASGVSASTADYIAGVDSRNHFKNATRNVAKLYQSMDTVWKIHTFYSYLPEYKAAYPNMSDAEVRKHVAKIVRDITPTYSEASKAARFWARYMPVGPFAMFNAEMFRTTGNRIRLTAEEAKSGNPVLQKLAAKRAVGQLAALTIPAAVAMAAKQMLGMSDEEEEAIRERVAPWQKNAVIIPTSRNPKTGQFGFFDASYNDPFSMFSNAAIALSRGEPGEAAVEMAEPFASEDLTMGAIMSIMRNKDANGRPVFDPGLGVTEQLKQIVGYAVKAFEPGTLTSARRINRAARGETSLSGQQYKLGAEVGSLLAGVRLDTLDRAQSDFFRNRQFETAVQDSERSIRKMFTRQGSFDAATVAEQYESAEAKRKQSLADWRKYVDGSILLGEEAPFAKVVSDTGGTSGIVKMMYARQYWPYRFKAADIAKMRSLPDGEARVSLYLNLAERIRQQADATAPQETAFDSPAAAPK